MNELMQFLSSEEMLFEPAVSAMSEIQDWGLMLTGVLEAHKHSKGENIIVALLDTGVSNHFDLIDNLLPSISVCNEQDLIDRQGHGTFCAGIIAASENGVGVLGVAPKSKILPIKILNKDGISTFYQIYYGIKNAVENNVDIISMSLNIPVEPPTIFHDIIKEAYNKGIIIICSAGNDGKDVQFPAKYDEVIAVAAIDQSGNLADYSSRGDNIAVEAPGSSIYSTFLDNQYAVKSGTSMASPFLSGICALLLSWDRKNDNKIKNSQDMLKMLDELCDPIGRIVQGKENNIGFGVPQFANFMPWK
jgi:subtilisin family serine protease